MASSNLRFRGDTEAQSLCRRLTWQGKCGGGCFLTQRKKATHKGSLESAHIDAIDPHVAGGAGSDQSAGVRNHVALRRQQDTFSDS